MEYETTNTTCMDISPHYQAGNPMLDPALCGDDREVKPFFYDFYYVIYTFLVAILRKFGDFTHVIWRSFNPAAV